MKLFKTIFESIRGFVGNIIDRTNAFFLLFIILGSGFLATVWILFSLLIGSVMLVVYILPQHSNFDNSRVNPIDISKKCKFDKNWFSFDSVYTDCKNK